MLLPPFDRSVDLGAAQAYSDPIRQHGKIYSRDPIRRGRSFRWKRGSLQV